MAFNNSWIVSQLIKRGVLIKTEKWDEVKKINQVILDRLKDEKKDKHDETFLDKIQEPVSCFVTFEEEESYQRACHWKETPQRKFLKQELDLQEASEPTDIIWENRHFTPHQRFVKRVAVYIIIVIMLTLSAGTIYFFTKMANTYKFKYPIIKCANTFDKQYSDINDPNYIKKAVDEFNANVNVTEPDSPYYTGVMQCFCQAQKKAKANDRSTDQQAIDVCKAYNSDVLKSKVYGTSVSMIIVVVNQILKMVIISGITWVGEDTNSEQLSSITNGVFIAQFFNTGLLILLVNGNMTEHSPKFFTKYIAGSFYDYMPDWYSEVGAKIVTTMIVNAILPFVTLATSFIIPALKIKLDQKFSGDVYKTKKTSFAAYRELYTGADYVIHFKYAGILNIMFITMMYGLGMPILFPIAAFNFLNQYICERIIVAYTMRQPPALDDKLTVNALSMLRYAPLLFLANGYWMISNQ